MPPTPEERGSYWVMYVLPSTTSELPEAVRTENPTAQGALQWKNDFERIGYGGPCPPGESLHRHFFKI